MIFFVDNVVLNWKIKYVCLKAKLRVPKSLSLVMFPRWSVQLYVPFAKEIITNTRCRARCRIRTWLGGVVISKKRSGESGCCTIRYTILSNSDTATRYKKKKIYKKKIIVGKKYQLYILCVTNKENSKNKHTCSPAQTKVFRQCKPEVVSQSKEGGMKK